MVVSGWSDSDLGLNSVEFDRPFALQRASAACEAATVPAWIESQFARDDYEAAAGLAGGGRGGARARGDSALRGIAARRGGHSAGREPDD